MLKSKNFLRSQTSNETARSIPCLVQILRGGRRARDGGVGPKWQREVTNQQRRGGRGATARRLANSESVQLFRSTAPIESGVSDSTRHWDKGKAAVISSDTNDQHARRNAAVDPEAVDFADAEGGPILRLCTCGLVCKAMVDALLDGDTARRQLRARLTAV